MTSMRRPRSADRSVGGFLVWKDDYSVSVPELDAQHRRLVVYINRLHDAMASGQARDSLEPILTGLVAYARFHFAAEERLLASCHYPDLPGQIAQHEAFTRKLAAFQKAYQSGKGALSIAVMGFMKGWLVGHIQGSDKKYTPFLAS